MATFTRIFNAFVPPEEAHLGELASQMGDPKTVQNNETMLLALMGVESDLRAEAGPISRSTGGVKDLKRHGCADIATFRLIRKSKQVENNHTIARHILGK